MTSEDTSSFAYLENSKFLLILQYDIQVLRLLLALPAIPFFCQAGLFSFSCAIDIVNLLVSPTRLRTLSK